MKRNDWFLYFTLYLSIAGKIVGVQIREMRVPSVVESGKKNHVILDCDYDISSESEGQQVDVKWFFRNDPEPFFQWLPGRAPQAKGNLFSNGRLDLTYEVEGGNRFQKHRALKIMRPTTELSGTYRCKVSSFLDEDFMQKEMIIYSPAHEIKLFYTKPYTDFINLTCTASGVFPEPEMKLSWGTLSTDRLDKQRGQTTTVSKKRDNGLYDVSLFKTLSEEDLRPETVFGCVLTIPGTDYSIKEETMYFPGKVAYQVKAGAMCSIGSPSRYWMMVSMSSMVIMASLFISKISFYGCWTHLVSTQMLQSSR